MSDNMRSLLAVCSFLGTTGYNYHARGFFTALNKHLPVAIKNWSGDDNPYYLTNEQKAMMAASNGDSFSFGKCISLCLHETNHEDWYKHNFLSPKIAFNVWESTRQPEGFFNKLLEFDQIWVPSKWQKKYTVEQGAPADKIFVIPEGIDTNRFKVTAPTINYLFADRSKFTFTIVGRWEYRKATTEMIRIFNETFKDVDDVELLLLVDNPFDKQKLSTEDKLLKNGLRNKRIRIIHKVSQDEYDQLIRETDCFLSCSRAEGWNLPLMEFMACGVPAICTDWSGQLEFASNHASLVKTACLKAAWSEFGDFPGDYAEPDFDHLSDLMLEHYVDRVPHNEKALIGADYLKNFTWENAAQIALKAIDVLKSTSIEVNQLQSHIKSLIVIGSHADTDEKLESLKSTVELLKHKGLPIIIVSHIKVPDDISMLVSDVIIDPVNTKLAPLTWVIVCDEFKLVTKLPYDYHALGVLRNMRNAVDWARDNYFNHVYYFEYDFNIDLDKHFKLMDEHIHYGVAGYDYEKSGINTTVLSFKINALGKIQFPDTAEDYYKLGGGSDNKHVIFENWLLRQLSVNNIEYVRLQPKQADLGVDKFKMVADNVSIVCNTAEKGKNYIFERSKGEWEIREDYKSTDDYPLNLYIFFKEGYTPCRYLNVEKEVSKSAIEAATHIQIKNFFINGAFVEILGPDNLPNKYKISFTDRASGQVVHQSELETNHWTRTNRHYFTDWNVKITCDGSEIFNKDISYNQERVMIVLDSKAMGDTLAWIPMVEEFRKKHNAQVICVTFWNKFFKGQYPEIIFVEPGSGVPDIYAQFNVGCFDSDLNRNKFNWRITPLQKVAADILGISPYIEALPKVAYKKMDTPINGKYVAISEHSTFMCKYWLYPDGWKIIIKYLNSIGYKVAVISKEATELEGIVNLTGKPIGESINTILGAELFIGVSSGPSWLAWALGKPLVLVSGYSTEWAEMDLKNPFVSRVVNKDVCHGCFNDPSLPLDRGNWRWCPRGRDFECSKLITPNMVIEGINKQLGTEG